jgi:hypothetical protein
VANAARVAIGRIKLTSALRQRLKVAPQRLEFINPFIQLCGPSLQQPIHVITRCLAAFPKRDHLSDFPKAQTDGLTRPDKPKAIEDAGTVVTIARG